MKPKYFDKCNELAKPTDGRGKPLPYYHFTSDDKQEDYCATAWKPSIKERIRLLFGSSIWIINNDDQPPRMSITIQKNRFN